MHTIENRTTKTLSRDRDQTGIDIGSRGLQIVFFLGRGEWSNNAADNKISSYVISLSFLSQRNTRDIDIIGIAPISIYTLRSAATYATSCYYPCATFIDTLDGLIAPRSRISITGWTLARSWREILSLAFSLSFSLSCRRAACRTIAWARNVFLS